VKDIGHCFPQVRAAVILVLAGVLTGCDSAGGLPESGFLTRYVMSADASENASAGRQVANYSDDKCRRLAQTRVSDATMYRSFEVTPPEEQKIYNYTYADCMKWQGR
jgi:hypothetical protein